jgi:hypothetical protein
MVSHKVLDSRTLRSWSAIRPRIAFNALENLSMLLTRSWDRNYELAVLLGNEVFT